MPQPRTSVFISYRREETAPQAGRLYDALVNRFGEERVFMDIDSIGLGLDFLKVIDDAVADCEVLLAVIGREWAGHPRLADPQDFNRLEIESALKRDIRVVPVLVNGAAVPSPDQMPDSLASLARRQALPLTDATFRADAQRLIDDLGDLLGAAEAGTGGAWRAELAEKTEKLRIFRVTLSQSTHTLELRIGDFFDVILVDGERVKRKSGFTGTHELSVKDGDVAVPVTCRIKLNWTNQRFAEIVLTAGGRPLYAE